MLKPSIKRQDTSKNNTELVCVGHPLLGGEPLLSILRVSREAPSEKTNFSFVSSYQLDIASGLFWKATVSTPFRGGESTLITQTPGNKGI